MQKMLISMLTIHSAVILCG